MKIPPLTKLRVLVIITVSCVVFFFILYLSYTNLTRSYFSDVLIVQSIILTFMSGVVSGIPRILYGYGTFSEDYEQFKTFSEDMRVAYNTLKEIGKVEPDDTGFEELCDYLVEEGEIDPMPSDKSIIEISSPGRLRANVMVGGEDSNISLFQINSNMKIIKDNWEKERDNIEKRRKREYTILGTFFLFLAIILQIFHVIVF